MASAVGVGVCECGDRPTGIGLSCAPISTQNSLHRFTMNRALISTLGVALAALSFGLPRPTSAIQLADGTVYFEQPPRLVELVSNRLTAFSSGATYYVTVELPAGAGEPLQRLSLVRPNRPRGPQQIIFRTDDTVAFEGTRGDRGDELTVAETLTDSDNQTIDVVFDSPIEPGTTVTVGLRPRRNPRAGGIYQFRVFAFPQGDQAHGQPLGTGRIDIQDARDRFFIH